MNLRNLNVFSIVLDGMPWLACIYAELMRLDADWRWVIAEGVAMNVKDTRWCTAQPPRLSKDGTTEFLQAIAHNPRVSVIQKVQWAGKVEMCNAALARFDRPGVLLQQDSDELWTVDQYRTLLDVFEDNPDVGSACFDCRYFVGPNIVTTDSADWWRAWRFEPGDQFRTHEPPLMAKPRGRPMARRETSQLGLKFDHWSYALPQHVVFKERYYGRRYQGAVAGWQALQTSTKFPTAIKRFFPWSADATMVDRVFNPPDHARHNSPP